MTKASNRFRASGNATYEWKEKYDGYRKSLIDKSHRPHHHPLEHTQEEYDLITRYWNKNADDKIVLLQKIRDKGYNRCCKSMCRAIKRLRLSSDEKRRKRLAENKKDNDLTCSKQVREHGEKYKGTIIDWKFCNLTALLCRLTERWVMPNGCRFSPRFWWNR